MERSHVIATDELHGGKYVVYGPPLTPQEQEQRQAERKAQEAAREQFTNRNRECQKVVEHGE